MFYNPCEVVRINYVKTVKNYDVPTKCKRCNSRHIRKNGIRQNRSGVTQLMKCRDCGSKFPARFGFRYRRYSRAAITECLRLHFSGLSVGKISENLEVGGSRSTDRRYSGGSSGTAPWRPPTWTGRSRRPAATTGPTNCT